MSALSDADTQSTGPAILISIVIPVLNEEGNIDRCYRALVDLADKLKPRYELEFIFTDNASTDATFPRLAALAANDSRVRVLRFSRNFGYQRSILTGYCAARGSAAIQLDCDLQDPPALIPTFLAEWEAGHQVVYGVRKTRRENFFITQARKVFYRLIRMLSEDELPLDAGDFRLVDERILNQLRVLQDASPYLRGAIASMGYSQKGIVYERDARLYGETKFRFRKLLSLALDGILNHSITPLRFASFTGLAVSLGTLLAIIGYAIGKLAFGQEWPAGFATNTILVLFSVSLNALFLGIIGEYLGRIFKQVKFRYNTLIETSINCEETLPGKAAQQVMPVGLRRSVVAREAASAE